MPCEDESQECKDAREDYDNAENARATIERKIERAKDVRNASGGLGAAGAVVLAGVVVVSGPIGWIGAAAVGAIVGGAAFGVASQAAVETLRDECEAARLMMFDAYTRAVKACRDKDCVPPRSWTRSCA